MIGAQPAAAAADAATVRIRLIASTAFVPPPDVPWTTDADGGEALAEFAGRACYQSWSKPNPATDTNATFLAHILQVGHLSVLEHSTATFYITGLSRATAAEFTRHRHFSFSQLSARSVGGEQPVFIEPPAIAADPDLHRRFVEATETAAHAYRELLDALEQRAADQPDGTLARKQARQAANGVLPQAASTSLVVTGNYRSWRHFVGARATDAADRSLRDLAVRLLVELQAVAPHVFADFRVSTLPDGTSVAASPLVGEG